MSDIKFIQRNLKGMYYFGLWDYYNYRGCKKISFEIYGKTLWSIFLLFAVTQLIEMYNLRNNLPLLMENAGVTLLVFSYMFKTGTILFKKKKIELLLKVLQKEEKRALNRSDAEKIIYNQSLDQNWFITKLFWITCWATIVMFYSARPIEYLIMGPQELHHNKIPFLFSAWYPYNKFEGGKYVLTYIHQVFIGWGGTNYTLLGDTMIFSFMIFAIGQFKMIQHSIKNLHELIPEKDADFEEKNAFDIYNETVDIIKHHCRIIQYLENLDDLIKPIIFVNFLVCSLMICSVGFEAIIAGLSIKLIQPLQYLSALLIQLFLFYWHANEITLESLNVGYSVGECQWYKFSPRVKHALRLLLIRAQKPCFLSVGGVYRMSLSTFLMILRATYSYLALFRSLYLEKNQ